MKAILKAVVFRSPLSFAYLITVLVLSVVFASTGDDAPSFAVWCWVCLYAIGISDTRQVKLERSLPIRKETIVDARCLLMLAILLFEAALALWQGARSGSWGMPGLMVAGLFLSSGIWILGSLGIGGKAVSWVSLGIFASMILGVFFGRADFAPRIGMEMSLGLMAAGIGTYAALWIAARRLIYRADC